ncbi:MAG TPA: undecaprenyl-diphosphate phosphatase [Aquifex aeolicus]|uniref:Undecaprenyl-diphosphatase n=1 Tax=Aquifex aeolicus TaxID=63363 RepID=A0A9D1CFA8_AQUAO|nr:undecaprenyl-diphosphate phosphatase [Aquificales bacterium]HIP98231.1 undecaprenyl-diphosphate phosphatase [Aquifex aeolicus]HIQ26599.1 undecaprenyl-diphosphate phosphatase [Aquifex aeolicus]
MDLLDAVILGIVEGLTEFLPVSSTGHMIVVSGLLGLKQTEFQKTFEVAIQLGAILAVLTLYRDKLLRDIQLWKKLLVAFIPTGALGFLFYKFIKGYLFNPFVVSFSLILGGIVFILVERWIAKKTPRIESVNRISYPQAFLIGLFQALAMVPGTSRSGATILGGLLLGMNRTSAAEFSFLLAIPTMFAAVGYDLFKQRSELSLENWQLLAVGFISAFVSAYIVVKWFLNFIKKHSFVSFGIYRILAGMVFLVLTLLGIVQF